MIELFGTNYYIMFPSVIIFLFFSFLSIGLVAGFKRHWHWKKITAVSMGLIIGIFIIVFGDVYLIGQQATKLCKEEGGLHVYKTAEAEGFIGTTYIEGWSKFGFQYVEDQYGGKKYRYVMKNGAKEKIEIDQFIGKYFIGGSRDVINKHIVRTSYSLSKLESKEMLGEVVFFSIYPGWIDSRLVGASGFSFTPWFCGDKNARDKNLSSTDVIRATLKPVNKKGVNK